MKYVESLITAKLKKKQMYIDLRKKNVCCLFNEFIVQPTPDRFFYVCFFGVGVVKQSTEEMLNRLSVVCFQGFCYKSGQRSKTS